MYTDTLVIIPARGGSKGLPKKNILPLGGKPLILHTVDFARKFFKQEQICVSTDNAEIKNIVEDTGLSVPFIRPPELSTDRAAMNEVLTHAYNFFLAQNIRYQKIFLMQPTSPFRKVSDVRSMFNLFNSLTPEMVVSVGRAKQNPYFSLFEENAEGFLQVSKKSAFIRRQDCPYVYYYNGSAYLMKADAFLQCGISGLKKIVKYIFDDPFCIDIDSKMDFLICESLLKAGLVLNEDI